MPEDQRCNECGAAPKKGTDAYCTYCGARMPRPAPAAPVGLGAQGAPSPRERSAARFAELARHPGREAALASVPSATAPVAGGFAKLLFIVVGGAVALMMMTGTCATRGPSIHSIEIDGMPVNIPISEFPSPSFGGQEGFDVFDPSPSGPPIFGMFVALAIVLIVVAIVRSSLGTAKVVASDTESWPARVAGQSTELRGPRDHQRAIQLVTLEDESGERRTFTSKARQARELSVDDMGIAHTRADLLLGFRRLDV